MAEKLMKAARLHQYGEPIKLEQVPIPEIINPDEVLVRVKACGLCHTDIRISSGQQPPRKLPIILGHEPAGIIEEIGPGVTTLKVGDRVSVDSMISCGHCHNCFIGSDNLCSSSLSLGFDWDGGWAEYMLAPSANCFVIPEEVSFEEGAIITDAVATTFHAMRIGEVTVGDVVAIFGIGGLGVNAIQMAKAFGAAKVIAVDRKPEKRELALALGADEAVDLNSPTLRKELKVLSGGDGVNVAFEFIGVDSTIQKAIESVRKGGKAVLVGLVTGTFQVNGFMLVAKEVQIRGVWTSIKQDYPAVIELVRSGKVDLSRSITHRLPLEEINHGLEILESREGNPLRIVVMT
ncbi:alcohol dehydrogenase catalytic domain-containing protein [Chloroflexota bacterium]